MRRWLRALAERAWGFLERILAVRPRGDRKRQRWVLGVAVVLFVAATVLAYLGLPERDDPVNWWLLGLVVVVLTPVLIVVNAAEYVTIARVLGFRVPLRPALRVTVIGAAANILPIPGSVLIRVADLRRRGASTRTAVLTTGLVGLAWIGVAGVVGGAVLASGEVVAIGLLLLLGGLAGGALVGLALWAPRGIAATTPQIMAVMAVELAAVIFSMVRLYAVLVGLGHDANVVEAGGLMLAGVAATATGVFPGGLGLREILAAFIGPVVGLSAALGLFATALTRLADYAVLGPVAAWVAARGPVDAETLATQATGDDTARPGGSDEPEGAR